MNEAEPYYFYFGKNFSLTKAIAIISNSFKEEKQTCKEGNSQD